MRTSLAAAAAALLALAAAAPAVADDDLDEVRARTACVGGTAELRLQAEDDDDDEDGISVEVRVAVKRPVFAWRLVVVHERRIVFQGMRLATSSGYGLRYGRRVPDWRGRQTVVARLATGDGRMCRIEATI